MFMVGVISVNMLFYVNSLFLSRIKWVRIKGSESNFKFHKISRPKCYSLSTFRMVICFWLVFVQICSLRKPVASFITLFPVILGLSFIYTDLPLS